MALRRVLTPGRLIAVGVVLIAVVLTLYVVPSREYIFLPDPARPVSPLVHVAGARTDPDDHGGLYYVDVIVRKATLLEKLFGGLHHGADLFPASDVVSTGLSTAQQHDVDAGAMATSQQVAAAVALKALGKSVALQPAGVLVYELVEHEPAAKVLAPDDVILSVDGTQVKSPAALERVMAKHRPGEVVTLRVERDDATDTIPIRTVRAPGTQRAVIGIVPKQANSIRLPVKISIDSDGVVGPSAGLAFALDILEKLGRNVDRGHKVAATGEISLNGSVGAIGGIKQKTIGAREAGVDVFLVPTLNAPEARKYAGSLRIIPVKSFQQALRALATLRQQT